MTLTAIFAGAAAVIGLAFAYRLYETRNDAQQDEPQAPPAPAAVEPVQPQPPRRKKRLWAAPLAVFIAAEVVLHMLIATGGCADGWHSASIGRAGACSYHGGVNHSGGFILLISLALAGYTFYQVAKDRTKK